MLDRQWMIEREDRRDREMREREDRRDGEMKDWQGKLHRRGMWILGGIVTIAIVLATILGGAIEAGWIPNPRGNPSPIVIVLTPDAAESDQRYDADRTVP